MAFAEVAGHVYGDVGREEDGNDVGERHGLFFGVVGYPAQGTGRAFFDLGFDLFGGGLVYFDPGFVAGLENFGESSGADRRVGAEFGLPDDSEFVVGVSVGFFWHGDSLRQVAVG